MSELIDEFTSITGTVVSEPEKVMFAVPSLRNEPDQFVAVVKLVLVVPVHVTCARPTAAIKSKAAAARRIRWKDMRGLMPQIAGSGKGFRGRAGLGSRA